MSKTNTHTHKHAHIWTYTWWGIYVYTTTFLLSCLYIGTSSEWNTCGAVMSCYKKTSFWITPEGLPEAVVEQVPLSWERYSTSVFFFLYFPCKLTMITGNIFFNWDFLCWYVCLETVAWACWGLINLLVTKFSTDS